MKRAVGLLAGSATLAALWWWFGLGDLLDALRQTSALALLLYLGFALLALLGYSLRWSLISRTLGGGPPIARLMAARLAGSAVGTLVPSANLAGEPVRIALARGWGQSGAAAGAAVAVDRVAELIGNMVCSAAYVSVFLLARVEGSAARAPFFLLAAMLLGLTALAVPLVMLRSGRRPLAPLRLLRKWSGSPALAAAVEALGRVEARLVDFFRAGSSTFVLALLASLAIEAILIVQFHFLLSAFAIDIDLPTLLLVILGTGMARAVPSPAGLGALEAGQVAALVLAGGRPETGFVIGLILRLHETLWLVAGLVALSLQGVSLSRLAPRSVPDEVTI